MPLTSHSGMYTWSGLVCLCGRNLMIVGFDRGAVVAWSAGVCSGAAALAAALATLPGAGWRAFVLLLIMIAVGALAILVGSAFVPARELIDNLRRRRRDQEELVKLRYRTLSRYLDRPIGELAEEDALRLEVQRAFLPSAAPPDLPVLPRYLPRADFDGRLRTLVKSAQTASRMVMVVGDSSTGKTRACWEALRAELPTWHVWHPLLPDRPQAIIEEINKRRSLARTVVWLNDAQEYLLPRPVGDQVASCLQALLSDASRGPVLILASIWPQERQAATGRESGDNRSGSIMSASSESEDRSSVQALLQQAAEIVIPAVFTEEQLNQVSSVIDGDPRLKTAISQARDGRIAQFLAGVPELMRRYDQAKATDPAQWAVLAAAIDARRLGHGPFLPEDFLRAAAPGYIDPYDWDRLDPDTWFPQALHQLRTGHRGMPGPMSARHHRPGEEAGPVYRLADYLNQHGRVQRSGELAPPEFWDAAARHVAHADQATLGDAADARGLYRDAAQLHKIAAASGNLHSSYYLVHSAACLRSDPRPAFWEAAHANLRHPRAVGELLDMLRRRGLSEQAGALLARGPAACADLGDPAGVARLLSALHKVEADEQVAELLARDPAAQVTLEDAGAVAAVLSALHEVGADEQVAELLARDPAAQVALEDTACVAALLDVFREIGANDQGAALARQAGVHASLGDPYRVAELLASLRDMGADAQIGELLARDPASEVALLDTDGGVSILLETLWRVGAEKADEQADALISRIVAHAALADPDEASELFDGFLATGNNFWEETATVRAAAHVRLSHLAHPGVIAQLLESLWGVARDEEIDVLLDGDCVDRVSVDDPAKVSMLLSVLREVGADEQAAALARRSAAHANLDDAAGAAELLRALKNTGSDEAAVLLARGPAACADLGDPAGVARLLSALHEVEADEQVAELLARDPAAQVTLEDTAGVAALLDALHVVGADEQVAELAREAAAHASLTDRAEATRLLHTLQALGAGEQAAELVERLPGSGMFGLFCQVQGSSGDRFRFGREADGSPAIRWNWEDLEL